MKVTPTAGSIRVADTEVTGLGDAARRSWRIGAIGLVFQEFELLEYLTVGWNIIEGLIAIGAGIVSGSIALIGFGPWGRNIARGLHRVRALNCICDCDETARTCTPLVIDRNTFFASLSG